MTLFLLCVAIAAQPVRSQQPGHEHMHMPGMKMAPSASPADEFLMQETSGTAANPASAPMEMRMTQAGSWTLMAHALAYLSDVQQSGPRGGDKFLSTNWLMGMAQHNAGRGRFLVRAMVSLEPATVTYRRYPELFQTGETAYGRPITDAQHPHDLFMELSVQYVQPLGERTLGYVYLAPVGDPALGPVAFPHRASAAELPEATLAHHLQDSTHIANEVVTAGIQHGILRIEASGFHGAEPNENRWNVDYGAIDSWATRVSMAPSKNWSGQASLGRLNKPEALESGDTIRSTASLSYNRPLTDGNWASSLIWGRNHKTATHQDTNSYLLESLLRFRHMNSLTGRIELVDKDELVEGSVFRIAAYTLGYTRDVKLVPELQTGFGGNVTFYGVPSSQQPRYGSHPTAVYLYMRIRLASRS